MSPSNDAVAVEGRHEQSREAIGTVEAYEVDDGVVLHDAEEPFAWVEASVAVDLTDAN